MIVIVSYHRDTLPLSHELEQAAVHPPKGPVIRLNLWSLDIVPLTYLNQRI